MANSKTTSNKVASLAARVLADPNSSNIAKSFAGSALSQKNKNNETGEDIQTMASNALKSDKYNDLTKQLAASILSQSDSK